MTTNPYDFWDGSAYAPASPGGSLISPYAGVFALSSLISAASAFSGARANNRYLDYNARAADANAGLALAEGDYAYQAAHRASLSARRKGREFAGTQKAAMAGSGFSLSSGSYQAMLADTREAVDLDAAALLYGGDLAR